MERYVSSPTDFVGIAGPTLVYIGVAKREDFDKLAAPCQDHGEDDNGHVLVKVVGDHLPDQVTVIFQHWLKQKSIDAMIADMKEKHSAACGCADQPTGEQQ